MTALAFAVFTALTLLGFALSAVYSGLETGLYTLNPIRLTVLSARGESSAVRLRSQLARPHRTLSVLLIGTNASNYLVTYALVVIMEEWGIPDWQLIILQAVLITPLLFVFAETLPKDLFRTYTDHWTYWLTPFIGFSRLLFTVTGLLPGVQLLAIVIRRMLGVSERQESTSRQRISHLIREGVGAGVVTASQATLTDRALQMREALVGEVCVDWLSVLKLPADVGGRAREALLRSRNHTRLPVVDRRGNVLGILSCIDAALAPDASTASLVREPLCLAPGLHVIEALSIMRRHRRKMAIVTDERTGRPIGLVTLKDLVEPLTGKLAAW